MHAPESTAALEHDATLDRRRLAEMHRTYAATQAPELRARLLAHYDFVATAVPQHFHRRREPLEDLQQVARTALVAALARYDPDRGVSFSTYAWRVAEGEIKRYFRDHGWSVHVPRGLQERFLRVSAAADRLTVDVGRNPTTAELEEDTGLSAQEVDDAVGASVAYEADSLESMPSGPPAAGDGALQTQDDGFEEVERVELVNYLVRRLPNEEQEIVRLRYGQELTQAEISERIGCSQMYVSRRLSSVHARMRGWVRS